MYGYDAESPSERDTPTGSRSEIGGRLQLIALKLNPKKGLQSCSAWPIVEVYREPRRSRRRLTAIAGAGARSRLEAHDIQDHSAIGESLHPRRADSCFALSDCTSNGVREPQQAFLLAHEKRFREVWRKSALLLG